MRKAAELLHGCMAKALPDEMTFVLLSRDDAAPATIRFWAEERIRLGKNEPWDSQITEALACARIMEREGRPAKPVIRKCPGGCTFSKNTAECLNCANTDHRDGVECGE